MRSTASSSLILPPDHCSVHFAPLPNLKGVESYLSESLPCRATLPLRNQMLVNQQRSNLQDRQTIGRAQKCLKPLNGFAMNVGTARWALRLCLNASTRERMAGIVTTSDAISARYNTSFPSDLSFRCGRQAGASLYLNSILLLLQALPQLFLGAILSNFCVSFCFFLSCY